MVSTFDQRASARRRDEMTLRRLDVLVPALMEEHDVDCWVITSREYADDPVVMTMLPADWFSSRRRSILVFFRTDEGVERLSVARYDTNGFFPIAWDPESQPNQWKALAELIDERDPRTVAVNTSPDFAHGDGLTHSEYLALSTALGDDLSSRLTSADPLTVNWLESRLPAERAMMESACETAHGLLRRALSEEAIQPGTTSTEDVTWWLRDRVAELGTVVWFQPTVSVQRAGGVARGSFAGKPEAKLIERGDLVHIDFGIVGDGLCTDQQQHAYVLDQGETEAPPWLVQALGTGNRLQDILTAQFESGRTGNEVLTKTRALANSEGIEGKIYTHPIGFQGHGAGPTIGLWDNQDRVVGSGDRAIRPDTAWSIELMVEVESARWGGQAVAIMLEEDAWFDGASVHYLDGRQTAIWEIG